MAFEPGHQKFGGREKGTPNKRTLAQKEALDAAFDELGGVDGLVQWARRDPHGFYTIWGKNIPKDVQVTGKGGEPIVIRVVTGVPDADGKNADESETHQS